ncbi:hypothetical protein C1H46_014815 [Malus baccata]|uniref:Uncharacterized protein n=1 Tax=Malus baccata TaxID=106549 RepID=A0A540MMI1_MALBA|nr:hypothetical protein C1H46_014815 [Malus baccata]
MFTEGLDRSALHWVREPSPMLVDPGSKGSFPLFAFLFSPDISANMIRQTRRSHLLSWTRLINTGNHNTNNDYCSLVFILFGAFMAFVANGTPSLLESQVRIARFFRFSGIDSSSLHVGENGLSVARNNTFTKYIQECVIGCF